MKQKAGVLDYGRCIDVEEEAFRLLSMGDYVMGGDKQGRTSEDERICFIASGMPVWDIAWGYELYENAKKKGLGQNLLLWDGPHLA